MNALTITDGSAEIVRGALAAGVELFAGYPITPASRIYEGMVAAGVGVGCPDEITVAQTLIGASLAGRKVMTATSAPGYALMIESMGAAWMMEAPLTVVLVQRMGPATGSATVSAQGDLLAPLAVSGGYPLPTLCPGRLEECAHLTATAVNIAELLRTPVILLTEREMVSTRRTVVSGPAESASAVPGSAVSGSADSDPPEAAIAEPGGGDGGLREPPPPVYRELYSGDPADFRPFGNLNRRRVPSFLPAGSPLAQTRFTASTHGEAGTLLKSSDEALANTARLQQKIAAAADLFPPARLSLQPGALSLIVSFGSVDYAARQAVMELRARNIPLSHASLPTLYPVPVEQLRRAAAGVERVIIPEENPAGLYRKQLLGEGLFTGLEVVGVNQAGAAITPGQIAAEVSA